MLLLLTGSAGSGKSAALAAVAARHPELVALDLDDLRPPDDVDRRWWRDELDRHVRLALEAQAAGRDTLLAGWTQLDEVCAIPAAAALDGVAACLLDCDDVVRLERIERRTATGTWGPPFRPEQLERFLAAAADMRASDGAEVFRLDTSRLTVSEVGDALERWMAAQRREPTATRSR